MKLQLPVARLAFLVILPACTGCTIQQVIDSFYPQGGPNEPGISKQERQARFEEENIRQATGQPFTSDRQ